MQTSDLTERVEAALLEQVFSDDVLENRARSLLRWKIRFNAVRVAVVSGHVTLSGQVISALDRETAEQTIRRLRGVVGVTNCIIASLADPPNSLQYSLRCAPQPTLGNYGTNDEAK